MSRLFLTLRKGSGRCDVPVDLPGAGMALAYVLALALTGAVLTPASAGTPDTVYFPASDGKAELVGYLYAPASPGPHPAVVLLHGRSGPYSSKVNANCKAIERKQIHCSAFLSHHGY